MNEISFLKKNKERRNKFKGFSINLVLQVSALNCNNFEPGMQNEEWVDFKTMLAANFTKLVHIGFFRSAVHVIQC